ncbi:interferon-inducible GTPase 5 isoform X2 [Anolis carolinensis]|uniref:interferon-inducible GTPase 5 isoform X2 n=1 Tax=Anolis carolinensis TaxID=28377 RepID=UPI002F2B5C73
MEASVVVAGPPGAGKTALLDALLGAEAAEEKRGAGPAGGLRRPSLRAHPRRPDWLFWELSLPEEEEEEEEGGEGEGPGAAAARWVEGAGAAALVLLCGRRGHFGARARGLAREARAAGRSVFFVRSRADLELHTLRRLLPPPRPFDRPQALRALREVAQEEAGADAEPGGVFLVSALQPRDLDLPRLRASLQALLRAQERVQGPPDLGFEVISDREAAEIQEAYALGGLAAVADRVEGSLEALWSARVDLALVAEEGEREGAALLEDLWGVEGEPPAEPPTPHPFPGHPSVTLWELPLHDPGDVDVARFDAFLLLSSGPFGEGLLRLADEVAARGKPCFFICTEVDRDPETLQKKKAEEGEEEEEEEERALWEGLRAECRSRLSHAGVAAAKEAPLFLLSSRQPRHWDLPALEEALERGLPGHKGQALLLALPCASPALVESKRQALHREAWKAALLSSLVATVPLPGLAAACDVPLLLRTLASYRRSLGLDAASLARLSSHSGVPLALLRREVRSAVGRGVSQEAVEGLLAGQGVGHAGLALAHLLAHRLPVCGALASGGLSFHATYALLGHCLEEMADDAQRLLRRAGQGGSSSSSGD